jgi:hypothetical protein
MNTPIHSAWALKIFTKWAVEETIIAYRIVIGENLVKNAQL